MPQTMSLERRAMIKAFGAEVRSHLISRKIGFLKVFLTDCFGMEMLDFTAALAERVPNGFYMNQFANPANSLGHYTTAGPEIWRQTGGKVAGLL